MTHDRRYKSSIPSGASERIAERYDDGSRKLAEFVVDGKVVGARYWDEDGHLELERPLKNGLLHGVEYTWCFDGILTSAEPYIEGKPHGVAKQWSPTKKQIGSYKMVHGTGIDLWWNSVDGSGEGPFFLSEVHYMRDGHSHGYTWWINEDQASVSVERRYFQGAPHGIEREWNEHGRLCRGFPRYFVNGKTVSKRQYIRAAAADDSLPAFRVEDNDPARVFPEEIRRHLSAALNE